MRLFIATTFPSDVLGDVNDRVARVRSHVGPASWVRPESQHLTFAFLGEQREAILETLVPLVAGRLATVQRFEGRLRGCGFFPNPRHARVAWVGAAPEEKFCEAATQVREAVREAGVRLDHAEFKPHLTLCRIRDPWPPACIDAFRKALGEFESRPFVMERLTLFSSRLDPAGAVHTPLHEFTLA
jgi:2'-5' RNA ligase